MGISNFKYGRPSTLKFDALANFALVLRTFLRRPPRPCRSAAAVCAAPISVGQNRPPRTFCIIYKASQDKLTRHIALKIQRAFVHYDKLCWHTVHGDLYAKWPRITDFMTVYCPVPFISWPDFFLYGPMFDQSALKFGLL